MRRALLPGIAASLGFGLALGHMRPLGVLALAPAGLLWALAVRRKSVPFLWASALFLGLAGVRPPAPPGPLARQLPLLRECTGYVVDLPEPTPQKLSFTVEIPNLGVRLLAYVPPGLSVGPGQRVRLLGQYGVPEPAGYREYLARRGIHGLFWAERGEVLSESPGSLLPWAARTRETLRTLLSGLPEKAQALFCALLLGSRGLLSAEEKEAFRKAGAAHLLALSGLHVGILVAGGWFLLGALRLPKAWRYAILIPLVGLYVLIGGLRVSLLRAALMFGILGVFWILWEQGWLAKRWLDPLQGLSLAAIVVLLLWPWSVLDAAFQLSFSATAGILLFLPSWTGSAVRRRVPRFFRSLADLAAVTLCAQVGVLPFLGATFGYLAPYGFFANLLLIPWTTLLLWAGILGLPLLLFPTMQPFLGQALWALAAPYLWVVEKVGDLPGAVLPVGENFGRWYLFALLGILILRAAQEEAPRPPGLLAERRRASPA